MTIYRVKYRGTGFLFDILSFIAFIGILATSALHIFYQQPWLNIVYISAIFFVLKTISKSVLAIKIAIDNSGMHDPTSNIELTVRDAQTKLTNTKTSPQPRPAAAFRPSQESVLQIQGEDSDIPMLEEVIAEAEPVQNTHQNAIQQERQRRMKIQKKRLQQQRVQELKRLEQQQLERELLEEEKQQQEKRRQQAKARIEEKQKKIEEAKQKVLKEKEQLQNKKRAEQEKADKEKLSALQPAEKNPDTFTCDFLEGLDEDSIPDGHADICLIDSHNLVLATPDISGELNIFETVSKKKIHKITFEQLKNTEGKKFRLFSWLAAGVICGLLICLTLVILLYNKSGKFPTDDWIITTMLPIMALATFGGLFTGILIPHKKTKIYILYTVYRTAGEKLQFVTGYKGFKRARKVFIDSQLEFIET
ncbi:hypothetical protein MNBD_GAMMA12-381 [hydrothermal vent metagenome]|uniref:Uncharacterized protein n=1 Tax=hydrothermal vent metagenome TaxID=652676 RepID=A0A3B0YDX7_9ZZZZ